ncbi:hypothetical protein [Fuscibacter oryzae]|uniref:Lipoprotein n=1 Tax=Fuscibacter oryzae TaxID=2803939 RepID=A0A8J7SW83_9RHOB|nr:hypothetical protein [Fuscibacter oryzae]MBL4928644.1 hypothetical protein [Fuscibacter oryzae]
MRLSLTLALIAATSLSACGFGQSRLNPLNWFGRSKEVPVAAAPEVVGKAAVDDGRQLVQSVLSMTVEPNPGGAIITATGLPPSQGWWKAELVALPVDDKGVLVLEFRVAQPPEPWPAGTQWSREITAGYSLSNIKLQNISEIVVQGETNARASRR